MRKLYAIGLMVFLFVGLVAAEERILAEKPIVEEMMPLGDIGKPADYAKTLKEFKETSKDYDTIRRVLPSAFDWRDQGMVTPAKDQGSCGSCWAFASVGALESKILMINGPQFDLSEQQQVSCNTSMSGCSGGNMSALRFWYTVGPMEESCTGYSATNGSCSSLSGCTQLDIHTAGYYTVNCSDRDEIKLSLHTDGPAYFRYNVYSDFSIFWNNYSRGHVYTQTSGTRQGGHAVLIIGWDDSKGAWLCKNSWGESDGPNGDGTFWIAYTGHANSLSFGMANVTINASFNQFIGDGSWTGYGYGEQGWYLGDFNGDGKDDIFRYRSGISGAEVLLSTGHSFSNRVSWTGAGTDHWYVGDFNGDGKDDIFRYRPGISGADMFLSSGSSFYHNGSWTSAGYGDHKWYVGDFNGDGKDDIFRYRSGYSGAEVLLSTGHSFSSPVSWTGAGTDHWYIGDFNGDGKDDIFRYRPGISGADVFLSNGSSFYHSGSWTGYGYGDQGWYVGDFNGDGKDDIFRYRSGYSGAEVFLSTGHSFSKDGNWTPAGTSHWYLGDFNGDAKIDIFRYRPGYSGADMFLSTEF